MEKMWIEKGFTPKVEFNKICPVCKKEMSEYNKFCSINCMRNAKLMRVDLKHPPSPINKVIKNE